MFRKACLTGATSFREPEHLEGANSLDLWAPPAKSFLLHILSEFLIWTFYNLTFNLYFHFCFLKTQVTKTRYIFSHCRRTKGRLFILYNFYFVKHPTRWSWERRGRIFSRPHFNWILSVGCTTKHPNCSLSSSTAAGFSAWSLNNQITALTPSKNYLSSLSSEAFLILETGDSAKLINTQNSEQI